MGFPFQIQLVPGLNVRLFGPESFFTGNVKTAAETMVQVIAT